MKHSATANKDFRTIGPPSGIMSCIQISLAAGNEKRSRKNHNASQNIRNFFTLQELYLHALML
jgi:hypothetical protein